MDAGAGSRDRFRRRVADTLASQRISMTRSRNSQRGVRPPLAPRTLMTIAVGVLAPRAARADRGPVDDALFLEAACTEDEYRGAVDIDNTAEDSGSRSPTRRCPLRRRGPSRTTRPRSGPLSPKPRASGRSSGAVGATGRRSRSGRRDDRPDAVSVDRTGRTRRRGRDVDADVVEALAERLGICVICSEAVACRLRAVRPPPLRRRLPAGWVESRGQLAAVCALPHAATNVPPPRRSRAGASVRLDGAVWLPRLIELRSLHPPAPAGCRRRAGRLGRPRRDGRHLLLARPEARAKRNALLTAQTRALASRSAPACGTARVPPARAPAGVCPFAPAAWYRRQVVVPQGLYAGHAAPVPSRVTAAERTRELVSRYNQRQCYTGRRRRRQARDRRGERAARAEYAREKRERRGARRAEGGARRAEGCRGRAARRRGRGGEERRPRRVPRRPP